MDASRKTQVLETVARWLEDLAGDEPLPEGLDPSLVEDASAAPDLASLTAAVLALRKDAQIQSKTTKRLAELLEPALAQILDHDAREAERRAGYTRAFEDLLDVYDRLDRVIAEGYAAAARTKRLFGGRARVEAIVEGCALVRATLDERLARAGFQRIESTGRAFDPHRMRAVEAAAGAAGVASGTVIETLRTGFAVGEQVVRVAEVRVAR